MKWCYIFILPLAGGVTLGLEMMMQVIISTEFVPQPRDRAESSVQAFIFEPPIICGGYSGVSTWNIPRVPLRPAQPKISEYPIVENPHDDRVEYRAPRPDGFGSNIQIDIRAAFTNL